MPTDDAAITYILRCHDIATLAKLKNAVTSVAEQSYKQTKALIALQNLPKEDVLEIVTAMHSTGPLEGLETVVANFEFPDKGDHRAALLNRALETVSSRYVAFLDYDDIVYPHHAETLISDLVANAAGDAVASFGGCTVAYYDDLGDGAIDITRQGQFKKSASVSACVVRNCFPIHCYVVDLARLREVPRFGEGLHVFEDYRFLLDLFEQNAVSTQHAYTPLCEYRMNNDNSNTVSVASKAAVRDQAKTDLWNAALENIETQKTTRSFRIPYREIVENGDNFILSRQPFLRGLFVCQVAKGIRKKYGAEEAAKFLRNPKLYASELPTGQKSLVLRLLF